MIKTNESIVKKAGFGETLVAKGLIDAASLSRARTEAARRKTPVERLLVQDRFLAADIFAVEAADYVGLPPVTLPETVRVRTELLGGRDADFWLKVKAVPYSELDGRRAVAFADPFDLPTRDEVQRVYDRPIWASVATEADVIGALSRYKASLDSDNPELAMETIMRAGEDDVDFTSDESLDEAIDASAGMADDAPIVKIVNAMMAEAVKTGASDIHFEALERETRLRYRIDGRLVRRPAPAKALHSAVVSRIKIMSRLDIAERRKPQDGRFKVRIGLKQVDVRVSVLPTVYGEKVVMRILDKANLVPGLAYLGLDNYSYETMKHAIEQPHGIILVTGPTGSGKTTTLYSCLQDLNSQEVNIVTAEDPVEYEIAGINQVHVNVAAGLTFAGVLRSVLRQDPDIVLVGEIRDNETADIAVKAALTGHLVLSTLHTNDAVGVIPRLIDMEVPPFLLASSLILAQAQRLYRKLCPKCRVPAAPDPKLLAANDIDPEQFAGRTVYGRGSGCAHCGGIGFKGRGAFMEVLPISDRIRDLISCGAEAGPLRAAALAEGMVTLKASGIQRVLSGDTSLEAALAVTGGD